MLDAAARAVTENLDEEIEEIDEVASPVSGPKYPRATFGLQPPLETQPRPSSEQRTFASEQRTFASEQRTFAGESRTPAVIVDATIGATGAARGATSPASAHDPTLPASPRDATSAAAARGAPSPASAHDPMLPASPRDATSAAAARDATLPAAARDTTSPAAARDATLPAARDATLPAAARGPASPPGAGAGPARAVPVGEFDSDARTIEEQTTAQRDPAEALLGIPTAETPVEELLEDDSESDGADASDVAGRRDRGARGGVGLVGGRTDATPATERFERGDPTQNAPPDATEIQAARGGKHPTGGTLRASAQLRRKRGLYGDVRYVFTALFGVRRSRRELAELDHRQGLRQTSRRRHLITLGRTAAVMDAFDHPSLGKSREQLALIEDERSKHAGAVAASDAELERVRRERENKRAQHALAVSETDAALAELAAKLEPLEKEAAAARKRASDLREEVHRIEKKIAETEASLSSMKTEKIDKATIHADIATLRANKEAVMRDEPVIASELDSLNPRIAAMEGTRGELQKKKAEVEKAEAEDQRRTLELLEAIGAKRKVVERAAADAETARDNALFELGERLYVDRPRELTPQLAPIDSIDLEMGEGERRAMELREIMSNIDKAKFARGLAMIILALGAVASIGWLIYAGL